MRSPQKLTFIPLFSFFCIFVPQLTSNGVGGERAFSEPDFTLKPGWQASSMPEKYVPGLEMDVNLGESHAEMVKAFLFQLTGNATAEGIEKWLDILSDNPRWRRIDLAISMAGHYGVTPKFKYGDPWMSQPRQLSAPMKKLKRDVGAVCMFFFNCPDGHVNSSPSWANNHSPGMDKPSGILKMSAEDNGYYNPKNNPGFWFMELLDARYAGLQFLLLNTYGPDLIDGSMATLRQALDKIDSMKLNNAVKLALFDDTWTWGKPWFGEFWEQLPDMEDPEACADLIFNSKWKPFFKAVPRKHWYLYRGRPLIYFYNGGTIKNKHNSAEVFRILKRLFKDEFGVEPYICADAAFWPKENQQVADNRFVWYSLGKSVRESSFNNNGTTLTHAMVRWDSTARENGQKERLAKDEDIILKDDALLVKILNGSRNSEILVIATWNDLGEGTGINRCQDYYWGGKWRHPTQFMELIRKSQSGDMIPED